MRALVDKGASYLKFLLYSPNKFTEKQFTLLQAVYLTVYGAMCILGKKGEGWDSDKNRIGRQLIYSLPITFSASWIFSGCNNDI